MNDIAEKIQFITKEKLGLDDKPLNVNASFTTDLGVDSLDVMELLASIEKEFSIKIPDEDAEKLTTPNTIITYVQQQLQ